MASKARTTSPAPCDPAALPKVAASEASSKTRSSNKIDWDKVKVVEVAELRTPYKFKIRGKKARGSGAPELWLQAGIEAGLVATGSRREGVVGGAYIEMADGHPPPEMKPGALEEMLLRFTADTLVELDKRDADKSKNKDKK